MRRQFHGLFPESVHAVQWPINCGAVLIPSLSFGSTTFHSDCRQIAAEIDRKKSTFFNHTCPRGHRHNVNASESESIFVDLNNRRKTKSSIGSIDLLRLTFDSITE